MEKTGQSSCSWRVEVVSSRYDWRLLPEVDSFPPLTPLLLSPPTVPGPASRQASDETDEFPKINWGSRVIFNPQWGLQEYGYNGGSRNSCLKEEKDKAAPFSNSLHRVLLKAVKEDKQSRRLHTLPALRAEPSKAPREMVINRSWRQSFNSVPEVTKQLDICLL